MNITNDMIQFWNQVSPLWLINDTFIPKNYLFGNEFVFYNNNTYCNLIEFEIENCTQWQLYENDENNKFFTFLVKI